MRALVIIGLIGSCFFVQAQSVSTLISGRAAGMGYASSVLADEAALFNNVGAMANLQNPSSFFAYDLMPTLPGANRTAAGFSLPTKVGVAGLGLFRFGDDLYSEQIISSGFSNKFGIASLGIKVNYIQYKAEGVKTKSAMGINFGGLAQITPQISIGAYIVNLNQSGISPDETLPVKLVAGLGFRPDDHFLIATELEKDIAYKPSWRTGAEYTVHKKVFFRTGFNLNPSAGYFGLGIHGKHLKMDYAIKYNNILGGTHQASAAYLFERIKK